MQLVSIVIPSINEAENIRNLLSAFKAFAAKLPHQELEIIVVDGGSEDNTYTIASKYAHILIKTQKGRAIQQNSGAEVARGDYLWFLHADSKLDFARLAEYLEYIRTAEWGRFAVKLSGDKFIFRVIEWFMNKRSCLSSIATGDQGIFVKKSLFAKIGGFPRQKLMEDIELSKRLKKRSPMQCGDNLIIETSSRKWEEEGIYKTIFLMWKLRFLYFIGVSPAKLYKKYYK